MSITWRQDAAPVIRRILFETAGKPESEIKQALYDAYPYGERKYHPYKIWLDEIRAQRGTKKKKKPVSDPNQSDLFQ